MATDRPAAARLCRVACALRRRPDRRAATPLALAARRLLTQPAVAAWPLSPWRHAMLGWSLTFLVVAIAAGILGFTGIAGVATAIAKILFFVFLIAFVISLLMGRRRPIT